ncbi:calcium and integrin-binding family member 2-like [Oratosquilla oratoria]|uniref:calcium and integrin-binding family member 2-like n=1 Tax=Oratosquilla oratoria TaxID=337810 RepID=UPI003F760CEB
MGQGSSQFSETELEDYQDLTYFTKKEILYAHKRFKELAPEKVGHNRNSKLPMEKLRTLPELRANPFAERICLVFSSTKDGDCTFEDFLDMMSVFSDAAPKSVKAKYAFRIFDFDGDDYLGRGDLQETITRLIAPQNFNGEDMETLISRVLQEADLDDDGMLAYAEFEHVISKSPDFANSFRIRL